MDLTESPECSEKAIAFKAILVKMTTLIDGGWRITFDIAQEDTNEILKLAPLKDDVLHVVVMQSKVV